MEKSWKMGKKNKVTEILKKSWISLLLITNHAREVPIIPYRSTGLLQWFGYGRLSVYVLDSQFVMLGGRQTIFLTPYFQFEKRFTFFPCMWWIRAIIFCVCLPGIMENGVNCHGKSWKSHGILVSDFCGNPANGYMAYRPKWTNYAGKFPLSRNTGHSLYKRQHRNAYISLK